MTTKKDLLVELMEHYSDWTEDMDTRLGREYGWNDIVDAYTGHLPADWPYDSRVVDPRLRTSIIEKKARLTNSKLRGRLAPREGSDIVSARINNALLDFQWDSANHGGSMGEKWGIMDQDSRLFASSFGLVKWEEKSDDDGNVYFMGNEFTPIPVVNVGLDYNCTHVRDARWVQVREWETIEDLENQNDTPLITGKRLYPGLNKLKAKIKMSQDTRVQDPRDNVYTSRVLSNKGLDDRMGKDKSFPVVEIVTEYRPDRWITFSPRHKVILRDIPNPYKHRSIPIVQLRYHPLTDDPWGESEAEIVLPIWYAIQAVVNGYLDNVNIHLRPPLKIISAAADINTIEWGPEAQWLVDRMDAVEEVRGSGDSLRFFQTTYSALVSAFNQAMGDLSQGISNIDPLNPEKTATEVKAVSRQQNVRDQDNQNHLGDALKDMMRMWVSNNQQFLFTDKRKHEYILQIIGKSNFEYFQRAGLDGTEVPTEAMQEIQQQIQTMIENGQEVSDSMIKNMMDAASVPVNPIPVNPREKNPDKMQFKPKLSIADTEDSARLSVVPEDLEGTYDYIPDVKSMAIGAIEEQTEALQGAMALLTSNPAMLQLLSQEGYRPKIKELVSEVMEVSGVQDVERFFESLQQQPIAGGNEQMSGAPSPMGVPGVPAVPPTPPQAGGGQPMAGPTQLPQPGGF